MEYTYFEVLQAKAEFLAKAAKQCDETATKVALRDMHIFIEEHINRWTNLHATFREGRRVCPVCEDVACETKSLLCGKG